MKQVRSFQSGQIKVTMDVERVEDLQKALSMKYATKIGILGEKNARSLQLEGETPAQYKKRVRKYDYLGEHGEMTNADVGLVHEKGSYSRNIPARSFLEVPLTTNLSRAFKSVGKSLNEALNKAEINLKKAYTDLGIVAEQVVQRAFTTSGDGDWAPLKHRIGKPLIDTGQLRRSIMSRVVTK